MRIQVSARQRAFVLIGAPDIAHDTAAVAAAVRHQHPVGNEFTDAVKRKKEGGSDPRVAAELITFLCSDLSDGISGKLISAPWDDWKNREFQNMLKSNNDFGTLRRIDNKTFFKK